MHPLVPLSLKLRDLAQWKIYISGLLLPPPQKSLISEKANLTKTTPQPAMVPEDPVQDSHARVRRLSKRLHNYDIENHACDAVLSLVSSMTEALVQTATQLANHRRSSEVTSQDVQLALTKKYGINIPGAPPLRKALHKQIIRATSIPEPEIEHPSEKHTIHSVPTQTLSTKSKSSKAKGGRKKKA